MTEARKAYLESVRLEQWTSFENLAGYFPIDGRYKFGLLVATNAAPNASATRFRFLARDASELREEDRHIALRPEDLALIGGPHSAFPEVRDYQELDCLRTVFREGSSFFGGDTHFGQLRYRREVDMTLDRRAGAFRHVEEWEADGFAATGDGTWRAPDGRSAVPLVEGRLVGAFDFFQKSWESGEGRRARWRPNDDARLEECRPQFLAAPGDRARYRVALCDVTSATNTRTTLAAWVPPGWSCGNTAPVLEATGLQEVMALLAVLNSMTFDWVVRRVVAGLHLNRFYLEATPLPVVSRADSRRLAAFAMSRTAANPRYASLPQMRKQALSEVGSPSVPDLAAEAGVEAIVARGYGLDRTQLRRILDDSEEDRRGLWRYFALRPAARAIAALAVQQMPDREPSEGTG